MYFRFDFTRNIQKKYLKKQLKYWTLVLLVSYGLTVAFYYMTRPFWFAKADDHTSLAVLQILFPIFILPISLAFITYRIAKKYSVIWLYLFNAIIICSCVVISAKLGFLNWADSGGSREHPDNETLMIVSFEEQAGMLMAIVGVVIAFVRLLTAKNS